MSTVRKLGAIDPFEAVVYHAEQCEEALDLADFAEGERSLSDGMAESLRKLAALHSNDAFRWAARIGDGA